ncbi:glycoside hydrolase family 3 C-terminal domain-containing protein [Marisediminicola senii]|uniref:glycoside hydrolase family 3 C-terminal domain-containing protein n=1 Tax=Marisediminicola senii TaxID=2711233 RepID=UPI001914D68A|nr:glycoside hydrolase family 3 C-terminal domain-containing protein [Marisediminicola senii]
MRTSKKWSGALVVALAAGVSFTAVAAPASAVEEETPIYLDTAYSAEERAADLVSRMTLEEKASLMNSSLSAAIPRLGVEAYSWWNEAAHGVAREGRTNDANPDILWNTTSYPVSLSLGSTWDPDLMYDEATLISDEAREVMRDNRFNLGFYSPTINLGRDPRWGRNDETYSEDPVLTAAMGSSFVNGMEGKTEEGVLPDEADGYLKTLTTLKHYAANNSEFNRRTGSSDMDDRTLREYYTKQFRDVIAASDPGSMMTSYNEVNGTPTTADTYLIDTLARQTFGFNGFFTSDCDSIFEIERGHQWIPEGYDRPVNYVERHAFANAAGMDLDCNQGYRDAYNYANTVPEAVAAGIETPTGTYNENDVDASVVRLMAARFELGEFDSAGSVPWVQQARDRGALLPQQYVDSPENGAITQTAERLDMARTAAAQSLVLLKNEAPAADADSILPLQVPATGQYRVAVVGAYADPEEMYFGGYSSNQSDDGRENHVTGYDGIVDAVADLNANADVDFYPGVTGDDLGTLDQATLDAVGDYDAVVVYVGTNAETADEERDRADLNLEGAQEQLLEQVGALNPNTVAYIESIGQVEVGGFEDDVAGLLWSSYNGQRKGEALADVLFGRTSPSGHLPFSWYQTADQLAPIEDYEIRGTDTANGRTYMYFDGDVSYPFGYGQSYTQFEYSPLEVNDTTVDANGTVEVTTTVTNTGDVAGADAVQLYVATPDADPADERPIKRLAAFDRVELAAGASETVTLEVSIEDLAFYNETSTRFVVDSGTYDFQLASSSADSDIAQRASVEVSGTLLPVPEVVTVKAQTEADAAADVAQRTFFTEGDAVVPQVTVALNDDQLIGYVHKGESTPFPEGMTVSYESNRPDVVSVTEGTELTAAGGGVATVTATASFNGVETTGTFVVAVAAADVEEPTPGEPTPSPSVPGEPLPGEPAPGEPTPGTSNPGTGTGTGSGTGNGTGTGSGTTPGTGTGNGSGTGSGSTSSQGDLAFTGANVAPYALLAGVLLALGVALVGFRRRAARADAE